MRKLYVALLLTPFLLGASCPSVTEQALDGMCTETGEKARAAYRGAKHDDLVARDEAFCVRCAGEEALSCTGDPKALPKP